MSTFSLVWASAWRRPGRDIAVIVQIVVAFLLFGTLNGIDAALTLALDQQRADFLYVNPAVRGDLLPASHDAKIRGIPGVVLVNSQNFLVGDYREGEQVIGVAGDPAAYFQMNDYLSVASQDLAVLARAQSGAIVGRVLATTYGWHAGDRVSLMTSVPRRDGSPVWEFEIAGVYDYPQEPDMANLLVFDNKYLDSARGDGGIARVARFTVKVASPDVVPRIIESIDASFANSGHETDTTAESENARARLAALGNIGFVTKAVSISAFVALLLSIGAIGMNSVRERTAEFGVLRALGFSRAQIGSMVLLEWCIKFLAGASVGLTLSAWLIPRAREYIGLVEMPIEVVGTGICWALVLAITCTWLPMRYATRTEPAVALAKP